MAWRKRQGYNSISFIAAFPNWAADEHGATYANKDGVYLRNAWEKFGVWAPNAKISTADGATTTAKDMQDEEGNRPFEVFADREGLANFDRINPRYFASLDRKMRHLSDEGFVPFLETVRRDNGPSWKRYFDFNASYARYVQYLIARYGAYNLIFSGIHLDWIPKDFSLTAGEFNEALTWHYRKYGPLPYGQPFTTLIDRSTYKAFGSGAQAPWLTMHTVGNNPRNHAIYESIEELFRLDPAYPVANLEPYYTGWNHAINRPGGETPRRELGARQLFRARDDVRLGIVGRARRTRTRHRRVRRHQHRRARGLAAIHLDGAALRIRRADAAPAHLHAVRRRPLRVSPAGIARPGTARQHTRAGRRPGRLGVPHAHRRTRFCAGVFRTAGATRAHEGFRAGGPLSLDVVRSAQWRLGQDASSCAPTPRAMLTTPAFRVGGPVAERDLAAKILAAP